jgi:AcrR family transcriptional regulator
MIKAKKPAPDLVSAGGSDGSVRERVLNAAFTVFRKRGFPGASTLEIATCAQVSKRDLYALFENKHEMMAAAIKERARRMRQPLDLATPMPQSSKALAAILIEFGGSVLRGVCQPDVLAIYRLAIAESDRAREIGRILDSGGRQANHAALTALLAKAQTQGLISLGDPAAMVTRYFAVLWDDLLIGLLMRVREAPTAVEMGVRARNATEALFKLNMRADAARAKSKAGKRTRA